MTRVRSAPRKIALPVASHLALVVVDELWLLIFIFLHEEVLQNLVNRTATTRYSLVHCVGRDQIEVRSDLRSNLKVR